jgi:hypothetical protein
MVRQSQCQIRLRVVWLDHEALVVEFYGGFEVPIEQRWLRRKGMFGTYLVFLWQFARFTRIDS